MEKFIDLFFKIKDRKTILFLGSGFSQNFKIGNWKNFINLLIDNLIKHLEISSDIKGIVDQKFAISKLLTLKRKCDDINAQLDFVLEHIYITVGVDLFDSSKNDNKIISIIKQTYIDCFRILKGSKKHENVNFELIRKILSVSDKIITTNYDNLIPFSNKDFDRNAFSENHNIINKDLFKEIFLQNKKIYLPIHGFINYDYFNFENNNVWNNNSNINFPIIDSFSTFQKAYNFGNKKARLSIFLETLIKMAYKKDFALVFFGYSFNDQFFSRDIMKILKKYNIKYKSKQIIYIFKDDFNEFLHNLFLVEKIDYKNSEIYTNENIGYIYFSDFLKNELWQKNYTSFSAKVVETAQNEANSFNFKDFIYEIGNKYEFAQSENNLIEKILINKKCEDFKTKLYENLLEDLIQSFSLLKKAFEDKMLYKEVPHYKNYRDYFKMEYTSNSLLELEIKVKKSGSPEIFYIYISENWSILEKNEKQLINILRKLVNLCKKSGKKIKISKRFLIKLKELDFKNKSFADFLDDENLKGVFIW